MSKPFFDYSRVFEMWKSWRLFEQRLGSPGESFWYKIFENFLAIHFLDFNEQDIYLDLASCGSFFPLFIYSQFGTTVVSSDIDLEYLKCQQRYQCVVNPAEGKFVLLKFDAKSIPLKSESVNKITLLSSLEHFSPEIALNCLHDCRRILKPGGKVVITDFWIGKETHAENPGRPDWHMVYSSKDAGALIRNAGFAKSSIFCFDYRSNLDMIEDVVNTSCPNTSKIFHNYDDELRKNDPMNILSFLLVPYLAKLRIRNNFPSVENQTHFLLTK